MYKVYIREREYHLEMKQINYERQTKEEYYDSLTDKLHQMRRQSSMGGIVNGFYNTESITKNFVQRMNKRISVKKYHRRMLM